MYWIWLGLEVILERWIVLVVFWVSVGDEVGVYMSFVCVVL